MTMNFRSRYYSRTISIIRTFDIDLRSNRLLILFRNEVFLTYYDEILNEEADCLIFLAVVRIGRFDD